MRVLLIGGSGCTGTVLTNILIKNLYDIEIDIFSRNFSNFSVINEKVSLFEGDRQNYNSFYDAFKDKTYDVVIDFIGYVQSDIDSIFKTFSGKIKQYIYISSFQVYSLLKNTNLMSEEMLSIESIDNIVKNTIPNFNNSIKLYALEKIKCEHKIMEKVSKMNNFNFTIFRPSRIYSKEDKKKHFSWILKRILNNAPIVLRKSTLLENHNFNPIYINDLAEAIYKSMDNNKTFNEVFNISQSEVINIYDLINYSYKITNNTPNIHILDDKLFSNDLLKNYVIPTPEGIILCNSKVRRTLDYKNTETIEWVKKIVNEINIHDEGKLNNYIKESKFINKYIVAQNQALNRLEKLTLVK